MCSTKMNAIAIQESPEALETKQSEYLKMRLEDAFWDRKNALRGKFHIEEPKGPRSLAELELALKKGEFSIEKRGYKDDYKFADWVDGASFISWRTKPADEDGYRKAKDALLKEKTSITDIIMSYDYTAALDALTKFEKATEKVAA